MHSWPSWVTQPTGCLPSFKTVTKTSSAHVPGGFFLPWLAFTAVSASYAFLAGLLVTRLAPMAAGSGVPQMKVWIGLCMEPWMSHAV